MSGFPVQVKFADWDVEDGRFVEDDVRTYVEDTLNETIIMGAGFAVVVTLLCCCLICCFHCGPKGCSRPDVRSTKCPTIQKSKKIAIATLVAVLLMTLCGVGLFIFGLIGWYNSTQDAVLHSQDAAVGAGDFLCTGDIATYDRAQDGSQCGEFSLDGFIVNINDRTDRAVDSVTTVVEAIRGVLVPTQDILDGLTDSSTALTTMETALNDYQDASQEVRDTLTQLAAKPAEAPPIIADVPDATDVPEIDDAAIEFLTDARAEVDDSIATVTELKGEIETEITKLDDDVIPEVEEIKDDILSITGDLQKAVYDVMEKLNTADEALVDTTEVLDSNKMYFWIWVALMAPLSILVPSLALNAVVGKKATLARCSCCCQFFGGVTFWLPIIVGYILLVQTLVGDVCDVLLVGNAESDFQGLFEVNLNSSSKSFGDTEINIGTTINNLLTCRPGCDVLDVEYTPDPLPADWDTSPFNPNNWPSDQNRGLSQAECFEVLPTGARDANGYLRLSGGIYNPLNNFAGVLGVENEFDFTSEVDQFLDDVTAAKAQLNQTALIQDSKNFINSEDVVAALNEDYTAVGGVSGQVYTDIDNSVAQIDAIFVTFPAEAYDAADVAETDKWEAVWKVTFPAQPSAAQLEQNNSTRRQLTDTVASLNQMKATVESVTVGQGNLEVSLGGIDTSLDELGVTLDESVVALDLSSSLTNAIVLYIYMAAPGHMDCSWLSNSFTSVVEEDICVDYHDGITTFAAGLGLLSAAGGLLIFIMLDCGNPRRTTLLEDYDAGQEVELGSAPQSRYPNLAFGQNMPSPIARSYDYSQAKSDMPEAVAVPMRSGSVTDTV